MTPQQEATMLSLRDEIVFHQRQMQEAQLRMQQLVQELGLGQFRFGIIEPTKDPVQAREAQDASKP